MSRPSVRAYRYGKGNMQLHYALKSPAAMEDAGLEKVALLHLTPGLDGVSKAANEAERGMLPETPHHLRRPADRARSLALPRRQRHTLAAASRSAAASQRRCGGRIAVPADGKWTETVREAYADRVEAILDAHIDDFADTKSSAGTAYSPADLETMNINLVGGDPYGGFCGLDQFFLWRPFKSTVNHRTPVPRLYHIGASTHPGPGLGGGSGFLLANVLD